jgi:hypothetical protein
MEEQVQARQQPAKAGQSFLIILSTISTIVGAISLLQDMIAWNSLLGQMLVVYDSLIRQPFISAFGFLGISIPPFVPDALVLYNGLVLSLHLTHKWARGRFLVEWSDFKKYGWGTMVFISILLYVIMPAYFVLTIRKKESRQVLKLAFYYLGLMAAVVAALFSLNAAIVELPLPESLPS